jgi:hypothetical protein
LDKSGFLLKENENPSNNEKNPIFSFLLLFEVETYEIQKKIELVNKKSG